MAVRTLQLRLVFTVGLFIGPVSALTGSNRAISVESQPLSTNVNPLPKYNVTLWFLREPEDVVTTGGQNVTLRCAAESSTGNLTISWLYEDNILPDSDDRWQINQSELRILNLGDEQTATNNKTNAGNYACLASNHFGAILSRPVKVEIATLDGEVTVESVALTAIESQSTILQCRIRSNPFAYVQWMFNNLPLTDDKRYVPWPDGTLLIRDTRLTDSGNYRCIATNVILGESRTSRDYNLKVVKNPRITIKPTLHILTSSNNMVLVRDTVNLTCVAFGWPKPTVQWIDNKNVTLNNSSAYTITNAQPKDSGNYICVAENVMGKTAQIFQLHVYQKPQFNVTPQSRVSPSAQTVRVDCQAKGIPPPRITWLKNGKEWSPDVRIKKSWNGLVFIQTMSTDSGIYQCVASNPAGRIWTAVQIEINSSLSPSPPENVNCRPFDDDKVCVSWTRPLNVTNITAFSIHSYYIVNGTQQIGPESLVGKPKDNQDYELMTGLKHNTNYTFYVRMYLQQASDSSTKVTCQTGVKGYRNLDIETLSSTSVILKWDTLSSDTLCNGTQDEYIVQWFRDDVTTDVISGMTSERTFIVAGLLPSVDYQFRVIASTYPVDERWTMYSIPDEQTRNQSANSELRAPLYLQEDSTTSTSTRLLWDRIPNAKYYTVCYVPIERVQKQCDETEIVKSYSPKLSITKLKPNTEYVVMVRAHDYKNLPGLWSEPLNITTSADVPSPVIDLDYDAVNASTVCVHWRAPENRNGALKQYLLSYTTDKNWSLERENLFEYNISADSNKQHNCRKAHSGLVSTFLTNLSIEHTYLVMVRAANEVGLGQPCPPIVVKTFENIKTDNPGEKFNGTEKVEDNRTLGIVMGIILAGVCIVCCVTIILLRRRCLKRRAVTHARPPTSSELRPAVAHYSSHLGAVQVRMEQLRNIDEHEIEHLVPEERTAHIPSVTPDHLDTKGPSNFPNGCINGPRKSAKMNGNGVNGAVHITENPQFYAFECNGNLAKNKSEPLLRRYEEDSNSNVKPIDVLFRFFDGLNNFKKDKSRSDESCNEIGLNCTQLALLDESHRKLSPVLEPNG